MDIQPATNQQPISDDQELAKVLAGVSQQANEAAAAPVDAPAPVQQQATEDQSQAPDLQTPVEPAPSEAPIAAPVTTPAATSDLDAVKQEALGELRPLVDKLDVSPEEKFDTYLLLLRSTDDRDLIVPAHEAARGIADEARRAQALLDIIKEIDYLSGAQQTGA